MPNLAEATRHALTWLYAVHLSAGIINVAGYLASALVLATFCMRSMRWLRATALASNCAFIFYAAVAHIPPVLFLHCILFPVNVVRLTQIERARITARRLLRDTSPRIVELELSCPRFVVHGALADPAAALLLAEREQQRVAGLLVARLPGEAAEASGIHAEAAALAAPQLLDATDRFLVELMTHDPGVAQSAQIASLRSRGEILRDLHDTLGELAPLMDRVAQDGPAVLAQSIGEGLATLLLIAAEATGSSDPEDTELLSRMTQDRSGLVERIRQGSMVEMLNRTAEQTRSVYALTALYERAVWLLHRYAALLRDRRDAR